MRHKRSRRLLTGLRLRGITNGNLGRSCGALIEAMGVGVRYPSLLILVQIKS